MAKSVRLVELETVAVSEVGHAFGAVAAEFKHSKHEVLSAAAVLRFELQIKIEFIRFNRAS